MLDKRSKSTQHQNLLIVDPNPCGSSVVNVEDLSISVELEVFRRSDDIIIFDDSKGSTEQKSNGSESETTRISFIDGTGGKKELTTKYTELNTKFNQTNSDLETLGIESIDISFNTSYTPIVKIRFKDIRGKLFEMGDDSPYGFLFRMPYPIFYLTVKGYFGKPVKYALHLTKFNGALDSDTGSFIITCDFIGYTYAFLSDLLMGYLRAIPYTKRAQGLLGDDFVKFDQLEKVITELNDYILAFKKNDEKLKALTAYVDMGSKLDGITNQLKAQIITLENRRTVTGNDNIVYTLDPTNKGLSKNFIKSYNDSVIKLVDEYNEFTKVSNGKSLELKRENFQLDYNGISYSFLELESFIKRVDANPETESTVIGTSGVFSAFKNFEEFQQNDYDTKQKYINFVATGDKPTNDIIREKYDEFIKVLGQPPFLVNNTVASNGDNRVKSFQILDTTFVNEEIEALKKTINNELVDNKTLVTENFVDKLNEFFDAQPIDFDGSIGSFFRIICNHVDLFIKVLRDLGTSIKIDIDGGTRTIQGTNKDNFTESEDDNNNSTITIKAFPEYVEKEDGALIEKWLGSNPKFSNFKEVDFINDLLDSLIKRSIKDQEFSLNSQINEKSWYPVNPLETKAFNSSNINPWLIPNNKVEVYSAKLLYQRMMLFLSYTNSNLLDEEIRQMAILEAKQMYDALLSPAVKQGIVNNNTNINDKISSWSTQIKERFDQQLLVNDGIVSYRHSSSNSFDSPTQTFIPITQTIKELSASTNVLSNEEYRSDSDEIFISSVASSAPVSENVINPEEFETFIKIIPRANYDKSFAYDYDSDLEIDPLVKNFKENEVNISDNVSNLFGGQYRTHEFLEYEHETAGIIPLFYEFYEKGNDIVNSFRKNSTEYDTFIDNGSGTFIYNTDVKLILNNNDKQRLASAYNPKTSFKSQLIENYAKGNPINRTFKLQPTFKSVEKDFSLFGSEFYYRQNNIGRAFLFLHTLPFTGLGDNKQIRVFGLIENDGRKGLLKENKIINFFNQRGGFVSVPYSWVLFMGALLYREKQENDFLIFNDGDSSIIPLINELIEVPTDSYLITIQDGKNLEFKNSTFIRPSIYNVKIGNVISNLPQKVKDEFILEFEIWTGIDSGWLGLRDELEIFSENANKDARTLAWDDFNSIYNSPVTNSTLLRPNLAENYIVVSKDNEPNNFILDLRDGGNGARAITNLLLQERVIINSTYRIWTASEERFINFDVPQTKVDNYLISFFEEFKRLNSNEVIDPADEIKQSLFNSNNDEDIKLSLYKNIKSIYEKWVVGVPPELLGDVVTTNLYDKFNFIDRAYIDIADKFKIAPTTFVNYWKDNTNINFYNFIARILRDNNFDFIPLPTYINYEDKEQVRDVFEPFRFNEAPPASGPSFVCMYFGEQSNKLNIDKGAKFKKNDSWSLDVKCNGDNITVNNSSQLPDDFVSGSTKVPYFLVKYADQNQSLFKSFSLNQSEFTETQESLEIIESLSNQNRNNSIGQNLFDIYNNRAYSCEVEMLGCAQIQPFMYFQLDNIPMFDGAYNIINTRHSIKANHMTTTFKGVRVRAVKTKMIDDRTLYAHLISNLNEVTREGADLDSLTTNIGESDITSFDIKELIKSSRENVPDNVKGTFINPLPDVEVDKILVTQMVVTSAFGARSRGFHKGIDFRARTPIDVVSVKDLIIRRIRFNSDAGGLYVDFKVKDEEIYIRYMHLSELTHVFFEDINLSPGIDITEGGPIGKTILSGVVFGKTGQTGAEGQPHLHMDFRISENDIFNKSAYMEPQFLFNTNKWTFTSNQKRLHDDIKS